ncbi:MAG TPA: glycosyltransferase family 1 protein [Roseiflexaceae bacterium]|nr:glycosyltransferase family 1 protein [Roseiflexaceae bacterium]
MRIGIDVRYLSHGLLGGVHTYVRHFVPELIDLADGHQIFLYADTKRPFELVDFPGHVTVRYLPYHTPLSSVANDLFMRRRMAEDRLDIAHFPANYGFGPPGARTVITLHDAINVMPLADIIRGHRKDARTLVMMAYLHLLTTVAVQRAHLLLTVSAHAAREIARHSGFDRRRIVPVPHAPTPDLRRVEDETSLEAVRQRLGVPPAFILADALKNPAVIVRAWRRLPERLRSGRRIVFFSRRPDPLPIVHEAVSSGEALLLVRPSRADLIALYSAAEAFVFPSWFEGFGIPILEAMTCGAPVIASNRSAIPEVAGNAALIVDAEDDAALAVHLTDLLTSPGTRARLRELGFRRAAQFSWRDSARRILEAYHAALDAQPVAGVVARG